MLDPTSPLPLYQQLAEELSEQIRGGSYAPGERIPSEHELASRYGLGRPTVRQATEVLVRGHVLERRRGSGTFVSDSVPEVDLFSLGGTLASFRRSGIRLKTRWVKKLARRWVDADADNPFSQQKAYTVERLGSVAGQPVLLERIYFDAQVFAGMHDSPPMPADSLSKFVEQRYRLKPTSGRQTFRVHELTPSIAKVLKLSPGTPVVLVKRTLEFHRMPSAIFAELYCHTHELVFAQEIGDRRYA